MSFVCSDVSKFMINETMANLSDKDKSSIRVSFDPSHGTVEQPLSKEKEYGRLDF